MFTIYSLWLLVAVAFLAFSWKRLRTYLHLFQQHEYDGRRFCLWLIKMRVFDKRLSVCIVLFILIVGLYSPSGSFLTGFFLAGLLMAFALIETNPQKQAKKTLVMTPRARRIMAFSLVITVALIFGFILLIRPENPFTYGISLIIIQVLPLVLVCANAMLEPFEARVQKHFWLEAHDKLLRLTPKVIGITGSFGKTSAKHILGHMLSLHAKTLITPGSVNTPMGVARVIREQLEATHKFLIVEMGAYGPGSIKRLCDLAPPDAAIITSIGHAHFERFTSLDVVAETKFELADAVSQRKGAVFFPDTLLNFGRARAFLDKYPLNGQPVAVDPVAGSRLPSDIQLCHAEQTDKGLRLTIQDEGETYDYLCPLFGLHQTGNIMLAYTLARHLGVSRETLKVAIGGMPQIRHRLEVKSQHDWTLIDDAYNANPSGMVSGMDLLSVLRKGQGRRIMITPGCVELGKCHSQEHERLGHLAAGKLDLLVLVKPERIPSMREGFMKAKTVRAKTMPEKPEARLMTFATFVEAKNWLLNQVKTGDAVLIANDLPDIYERRISI